jgi:hypothetical protein
MGWLLWNESPRATLDRAANSSSVLAPYPGGSGSGRRTAPLRGRVRHCHIRWDGTRFPQQEGSCTRLRRRPGRALPPRSKPRPGSATFASPTTSRTGPMGIWRWESHLWPRTLSGASGETLCISSLESQSGCDSLARIFLMARERRCRSAAPLVGSPERSASRPRCSAGVRSSRNLSRLFRSASTRSSSARSAGGVAAGSSALRKRWAWRNGGFRASYVLATVRRPAHESQRTCSPVVRQ